MALVRNFRLPVGIGISADYIETFGIIESSDTNTGSVVARGGAGIAGTLNVGGNINLHHGNFYTGFKSSSTANTVYTLPQNTPAFGSSVLSSSSSGLMHWDDVHALLNIDRATYGSFYSNQAQQVTAANTATPIKLNSTFEAYKVSIYGGSGTSSRIKIDTSGTYNIQFSAQVNLASGTQPQVGDFWFKIDGSDVPESNTRMSILGKDYETVIALNFIYTFTAGQYFELYMSSNDSNWRLERATGIAGPTRPAIPSIILSVVPVAETVGGSGSGNTGILSINGLNSGQQYIELGSSGTLPNIDSSGFTHTINIPIAGSGSTGLITTNAQTIAGSKTFSSAIIGNLSGTATTSENINTVASTSSGAHYLLFSPVNGASGVAVSSDAQLQFNPATNILTADTFSGNLSATASTSTNFYGTLTGNVTGNLAGTATTAQNLNTNVFTNNNVHYLTFTLQGNGAGAALSTSNFAGKLTYRPTDEQLSVTYITGTAFTATNLTGTLLSSSQTNITALGTITIGTWNANAISTAKGGTGQDFSSTSGLIKLSSGTASNIANPTASSIGISYLTADTSGNIHWKDNTQVYNGLAYDFAYYNRTGQGVTGTNGVITFYDVNNFENMTVTSNYSYAFVIRDKSNNNKIIVDNQNNILHLGGNGSAHELRLYHSNETSYTGFKANSTGTQTYILPPGKPSTGSSILQSDDSGNMIWVPMTTGGLTNAITSINSQTGPSITLQKGSSGTDFDITTTSNTVTFNLPDASASNRGLVTTGSQTFAGTKTFSSSILGNLSGTSTTSENVNVNTTTRSIDHYLIFTNSSSGSGVALTTSTVGSGLTYNPATNTLNALFFTGTATSSRNVHTAQYTNNNVHYLTFTLQGSGAGAALSTSGTAGKLTYRPADEQLSVTYITGTAFTATNLYGTLTGNVTGTATTSENVNVTTTTRSVDHYLLFTNRSSGSGVALTTSIVGMGLTYNPATNTLAAQFFTGTATTSRNVVVNTTTINQNHFLLFSNRSSGSGIALTASTIGIGFTVNPAENTLSAGLFAGNISGTGATFARATFTNDTEATDQLTGSVTFAGGIAVNKKVFAQSVETNGNVIVAGNFQAYGSIIQLGNAGLADTIGFICRIQSVMIPQANNSFDIGLNDGSYGWRNAAFAGHGTFANLYGSSSANLTGVEFSAGDVLVKSGKTVKFYETNSTYNTSFKANTSLAANTDYILPVAKPGTGASILQSDNSGNMIWVKAASPKATYVLSFGAGFTPTTGLDSVSIAIPYANDGSTSLTYTIKRVEVRTETEPGASGLAFYFERHTTGNVTWASANTIKGAASANFSVAQNNYSAAFTTITSSSGNNGEVQSGNYLRVNFASVGAAANVSISIMIQEN